MAPTPPTITSLQSDIRSGRTSAERVVRTALDAAAALNPRLNALLEIFHEHAIERAALIDRRLQAGEPVGPLAGVPVVIKDNICLSWGKTTCASRMLENYRSPFTATAAQRLIDAGAVVIGKANLDEFAMGSSGEHSAHGPTRNPWDLQRVPGGSSSGSAAAVASGIVPIALGSDTGGSIRQPAGWCNIVGLKPTYGRVSRYGLVAYASSLDQVGPFARTVADAAAVLSVIAGPDEHDSTCLRLPAEDLGAHLDAPIDSLRLGVPKQARSDANHPAVASALDDAIRVFARLGVEVVEVDLPHTDHAIAAYYIIAAAEASSNLARFDGVRYGRRATLRPPPAGEGLEDLYCKSRAEGLGAEAQRRIMLGTHVLSVGYYDQYYGSAVKVRGLIRRDFDRIFDAAGGACDAVLMPSSPGHAYRIGERASDPLSEYLEDVYTVQVNMAGLPAITVPGGFAEGAASGGGPLPVGVQLVGRSLGEAGLLRIARVIERERDLHTRLPSA